MAGIEAFGQGRASDDVALLVGVVRDDDGGGSGGREA
jgi:hypothetical protein